MPPPPRAKMYAKTGKLKTLNGGNASTSAAAAATTSSASAPSTSSTSASTAVVSDADAQQSQLELELCWCIQTMEASVQSGKLNEKQVVDTNKTIAILKSAKQPVIKKRQVMRAAFGDYRARMAEEEREMRQAATSIQFTERSEPVFSYFVKKSALQSLNGQAFKFDFPVADRLTELDLNAADDKTTTTTKTETQSEPAPTSTPVATAASLPLKPTSGSGNTFKFNFNVEVE